MNYLPIGSVVTIKGGSQPIMIYGRKQINEKNNTQWDYVACMYPEGNLGDNYNVFFDNEDIDKLFFTGFKTAIDAEMQRLLIQS